MHTPKRIQRKRTKGWRMPPNTVYVGGGSEYANPFKVGEHGSVEECYAMYERYLLPYTHATGTMEGFYLSQANIEWIQRLKGKNLACWCSLDAHCHADLLLKIANLGQKEGE